ncbi:MAG: nucleotide exchange factor GrpE [Actinomycetota bacterium]|jgi:molecular chaperone GrpE|nr:nucleotide exchange factor GrpE [Actinomycetota bacterium]MDA3014486.1 nucleotide exchange factor GrpE [Actinomycetota bacterium]MDA3028153.1 nucleotide exchange factor GrpE [Actinomycetota bacterium]
MSEYDDADDVLDPADERGSEVEDFTSETERPTAARAAASSDFGAGDQIDLDGLDDLTEGSGDSVSVDVEAMLAELERFKDLAIRTQADFENYRKRVASQITDEVDRATGRMAEAFLPVLDAAEAAFVRHPDEVGPLLNLLLVELKKLGLEGLDLADQPFDPEVAEAVAHEPGDGGEVVVAEVLRSGFRWKGRTLRPAMVRTKD